jgi:hypothetical protein
MSYDIVLLLPQTGETGNEANEQYQKLGILEETKKSSICHKWNCVGLSGITAIMLLLDLKGFDIM